MDNKVNFLRGTATEYEASTKDNDTFYYTTDDEKLYLGETEITGIEIDDASTTATDKTWSAKKINDSIPTKLPADGGNADTVDGLHASDIQIDSVSDTSEAVTLDNLQGGVPFSEIVLNGDIVGQEITLTACGKNLADLSVLDGKLMNGVSFAYDNGNVVLNGTATAQVYLGIKIHLSAGTYTVSGSMDKNARVVLRNKSYRNIADAVAGATVTVASDDYYVHIAISSGTVCDNVVIKPQLERGAVATEYEPYSGSTVMIIPDSNPYTVPNDIRQQDGINNVSISAGEVSVTGVKKSPVINRAWKELDNKAELTDIPTTLPANGGNAATVNSHTVESDVPADAVFTDTVYTHPTSGVIAGTYKSVTVDNKGHVTAGSNPTTLSGYGITDAAAKSHTHDDRYYTETEINTKLGTKLGTSLKGAANGLAELDANGKVPSAQLPSYVDDVLEYSAKSNFPTIGETGKIYVDTTTNKTYRWSGSAYVEISASIALGETSSTAYRGDRGKVAYDHSQTAHAPSNAEANVQSDWSVTDTASDAYIKNKPTSLPANGGTATKANTLSTARTIDGMSFNGSANITHYASCSTAAATAAKAVTLSGFVLATGAKIAVKFTVTNTAANPTLNVNSTGAKPIYYRGAAISAGYLAANRTYEFIYNGTQYELVGDLDTNTDTKVTAVGNHYKPSGGTTTSASGGTLTDITNSSSGIQVLTGVTKDAAGHVTGVTSVALKSVNTNTDTKVTQNNSTANVSYRLLLSANGNDTNETNVSYKSNKFIANPSTGAFYATGYDRVDISGKTLNINTLNLSAGHPNSLRYIEKTNGGADNISNIPVKSPFILDVDLIRWTGASDYITRQIFISASQHTYVRFCTNGTWTEWEKTNAVATTTANGLMSSTDKSKLDGIATGANNYAHPSYTARTGVPTANVAPTFGGTFTVTQPVSDATGHITAMNSRTITIPSTAASASVAGLVSTGAQTFAGNKTFNGQVLPAGASNVTVAQARKIYAGTSDMTAGTTTLETGAIYLVYE